MNYKIITTNNFDVWRDSLRDQNALRAIASRLLRVRTGNLGDIRPVGGRISEMRIFVGKGYRLYFTIKNNEIIILLCGGNKSTQSNDIAKAHEILSELSGE